MNDSMKDSERSLSVNRSGRFSILDGPNLSIDRFNGEGGGHNAFQNY